MGGQHRRRVRARCPACRLLAEQCLCGEIPRLVPRTRLVVVMDRREARQISNSGWLAVAALAGARRVVRGLPDQPIGLDDVLDPTRQAYLLFPSEGAPVLDPVALQADGRPLTLVVPDACWRQARRMSRHEPALAALPRVRLPAGPPGRYRLRTAPGPGQIGTFEAIARALRLVEGDRLGDALDALFDTFLARHLAQREGRIVGQGIRRPPRGEAP